MYWKIKVRLFSWYIMSHLDYALSIGFCLFTLIILYLFISKIRSLVETKFDGEKREEITTYLKEMCSEIQDLLLLCRFFILVTLFLNQIIELKIWGKLITYFRSFIFKQKQRLINIMSRFNYFYITINCAIAENFDYDFFSKISPKYSYILFSMKKPVEFKFVYTRSFTKSVITWGK